MINHSRHGKMERKRFIVIDKVKPLFSFHTLSMPTLNLKWKKDN